MELCRQRIKRITCPVERLQRHPDEPLRQRPGCGGKTPAAIGGNGDSLFKGRPLRIGQGYAQGLRGLRQRGRHPRRADPAIRRRVGNIDARRIRRGGVGAAAPSAATAETAKRTDSCNGSATTATAPRGRGLSHIPCHGHDAV